MNISIVELGAQHHLESKHQTIKNMIATAQHVETLGFKRMWLAEHHNTPYFISRAPEVTIPLLAANTSTLRIGSGSVLLNHYSPYKVAEVFTLLSDMFPGRVDMGIGRATTGPLSDYALQRNRKQRQFSDDSDEQLVELLQWMNDGFDAQHPFAPLKIHSDGNKPEFWLLGSSAWSAQAAATLGLNYAFAGFINPDNAYAITQAYKADFTRQLYAIGTPQPRLMLSLAVYVADTLEEAGRLAAPNIHLMQQLSKGIINAPLLEESEAITTLGYTPTSTLTQATQPPRYLIGTPETVSADLKAIATVFGAEELMIQCISTNLKGKWRSFSLLSEAFDLKNN